MFSRIRSLHGSSSSATATAAATYIIDVGYHQNAVSSANPLGLPTANATDGMIHTPNIDRLSAEGVRLESYHVQPLCSPTRGTIMTGRYVSHTGIGPNVIKPTMPYAMPKAEVFLPEFMRRAGYDTAAVGKWHRKCCRSATTYFFLHL